MPIRDWRIGARMRRGTKLWPVLVTARAEAQDLARVTAASVSAAPESVQPGEAPDWEALVWLGVI